MTRYLDPLKAWVEANRSDLIFYGVAAYLMLMFFVGVLVMYIMSVMDNFAPISDGLLALVFSGFCVYFAAIFLCTFLWASYWVKESLRSGTSHVDEKTRFSLGSLVTLFSEGFGGTMALGVLIDSPYIPGTLGEPELYTLVAVGTAAYCVLGYRRRYADLLAHAPSSLPEPGA